jgi:hypothetical protein
MVVATVLSPQIVLPWTSSVAVILGLVIAALLWSYELAIWHLYAFNADTSMVSAFVLLTYQATDRS